MTITTNADATRSFDKTTDRVDGAIKSVVDTVRDQATPYMDDAKNFAQAGKDAIVGKVKEVEETVKTQSDVALGYIRDNPIKSIAIAVGVGYALSCMSKD